MLKQVISRSSRAISSSSRTIVRQPLLRTQFSPAPSTSLQSAFIPSLRWYSDQTETTAKKDGEEPAAQTEAKETKKAEKDESSNAPSDVEAELRKKLEAKEKEAIDWKDKFLRSVADFRNLQDRTQREMKSARDFAIQKFAKDLVDSVDNLDRALIMGQEKIKSADEENKNEDLMNFYEGVKMTETNMLQTLQKHGLERFSPEGEKFNPNEHEATFMTPMPGKEDNTVFHVQQKGFKLNGRVLRAAKVGVVKSQ
ncbi:GrpE-domain-containing protein [Annulohypoxylon maeteangense]|uniref:GrpE-domain-containing protein n=1 Tax=Annulohypoxylon maeteangense TaxID=1927788 RepID=UPI0020084B2E|nr:GrpE-domain-containing protein [Annulohypoxylon maeteangense]KAI0885320.1 GrpE-domain-containing protein [Annulohypoxylon maeteangense]